MSMEEVEKHYAQVVQSAKTQYRSLQSLYKNRLPYDADDFVQIVALELGRRGPCIVDDLTVKGCIDRVAYWACRDELRRLLGRSGDWNRNDIAIGKLTLDVTSPRAVDIRAGSLAAIIPDRSDTGRDPADIACEAIYDEDIERWIDEKMPVPSNIRPAYTDRFREIVKDRYRGMLIDEIGKKHGVSGSRVCQVLNEAREQLVWALNHSGLAA